MAAAPAGSQTQAPAVVSGRARVAPIVQEVQVTGTVTSPRLSRVSAEVAGFVSEVAVDLGDRVEKGAPLVAVDPELARLDLARASAAVREARERLGDTRRRLDNAKKLQQERALAESQLLSLEAELRIDQATVDRLAAEEGRQRALLERHSIRAPFAGTISQRLTSPGEWVERGAAVVELVSTEAMRLEFQVPQQHFPLLEAGAPLDVRLDAAPERSIRARVTAAVPLTDASARTFLMVGELDEAASAPMIPGMSVRATLRLSAGRDGVVVPRDALLRYPDGRITVWTIEGGGEGGLPIVTERRVEIGRAFGGEMEITKGLAADARIVLRGNEGLREGQRVEIQSSQPPPREGP